MKEVASLRRPPRAAQASLVALKTTLVRLSRIDDKMSALLAAGAPFPEDFVNRMDLWRRLNAKAAQQIAQARTQMGL